MRVIARVAITLVGLLLLYVRSTSAQIVKEHTYSTNDGVLAVIQIDSGQQRYLALQNDSESKGYFVALYGLNHVLEKRMNIPVGYPAQSYFRIGYVTKRLFDLDDSIEYLLFTWPINQAYHAQVSIMNESGRVMMLCDSCEAANTQYKNFMRDDPSTLVPTPAGTKLILLRQSAPSSYVNPPPYALVYSLPGKPPSCQLSSVKPDAIGITDRNTGSVGTAYPNPSSAAIHIAYTLPEGATTADLILTDLNGKECKRYRVGSAFNDILINPGELASGTYLYSLVSEKGRSEVRKLVVEK
jgi:hypothetical protein